MNKSRRLTRAEIERRLNEALEEVFVKNNLASGASQLRQFFRDNKKVAPEVAVVNGMKITARMLIDNYGRTATKVTDIKDEEQLETAIRAIKSLNETLPTAMRKATKAFATALPRRGGPGRQPKLNAKEASLMCDQIAMFIRQGLSLKEALNKTAALTPTLLGKKVGARTLQKAWDKRDEPSHE